VIRFQNSLTIDRPVGEVFAFVSDFENMPKWNYFVQEVVQLGRGPRGVGTTYRQTRRTDTQRYSITEYDPDCRVTVETVSPAPALWMRFTFEPVGDATRLTDEWELETGLNALFERLGAGRVKSAVAENLRKLKQLLETGEVRLQDGRTVDL